MIYELKKFKEIIFLVVMLTLKNKLDFKGLINLGPFLKKGYKNNFIIVLYAP